MSVSRAVQLEFNGNEMKKETGMLHKSEKEREKEERKQNKILHALYKKTKVNRNTKEAREKQKEKQNCIKSLAIKANQIK